MLGDADLRGRPRFLLVVSIVFAKESQESSSDL